MTLTEMVVTPVVVVFALLAALTVAPLILVMMVMR